MKKKVKPTQHYDEVLVQMDIENSIEDSIVSARDELEKRGLRLSTREFIRYCTRALAGQIHKLTNV